MLCEQGQLSGAMRILDTVGQLVVTARAAGLEGPATSTSTRAGRDAPPRG